MNQLQPETPRTQRTVVLKDKIAAFTLNRSVSCPRLVNVVAVNQQGKLLAVVESDMKFEDGAEMVEKLNATDLVELSELAKTL
jgi:hypothetical protein